VEGPARFRHTQEVTLDAESAQDQLFSNMIQCLDRLYDEQTGVEDVRALLFATAAALADPTLSACMNHSAKRLGVILASGDDVAVQNRSALEATNEVRTMVARLL
jgi:hypothetical protein